MPEERKLVSVLFADIVGSTAMGSDHDPETVRSILSRYFERMKEIAEVHGGTVEKFIGDAVMVVFGVPSVHDDDAERAVRSAFAMRDAVTQLNDELEVQIALRMGVNTGEAVTASASGSAQFLVTGDAVNVAARLQQAAEPSEILVGSITQRITHLAVDYESREPISAKGKPEPVVAYRAVRVRSAVPDQARGMPALRAQLVGRQRELKLLLDSFDRVREERRTHLFSVVGPPGIGKTRLVGEALARISAGGDVRFIRGRCLPYGTGITWWPFGEIVREDVHIAPGDGRDAALSKLDQRLAELISNERERTLVRARLAVLLGLVPAPDALPEVSSDRVNAEIALGLRRYVEALARIAPVVLVIDDLQWGEDPLVAALEQIAQRVTDAALLVLCIARPDLLETRPAWGSGKANAALITLDPLSPSETRSLIARLLDVDDLPDSLRQRIVERSEGNPLFCEEFLRMLIDDGRVSREADRWRATGDISQVRVPETVQAVVAARLDRLPADERRALQVASVVGERFDLGSIRAIGHADSVEAFDRLLLKDLVAEDRAAAEPEAFRFKHLLIRDIAYASLSKAERADLHERFARVLAADLAEGLREELLPIASHHAERAFRMSAELRLPKAVVAPRAAAYLDLALAHGAIVASRRDVAALRIVSETAVAAAAASDAPVAKRLEAEQLALRYSAISEPYPVTRERADALARAALQAGDPGMAGRAMLVWTDTVFYGAGESYDAGTARIQEAVSLFERVGDEGGSLDARLLGLEPLFAVGLLRQMLHDGERILARALEIGDRRRALDIVARISAVSFWMGDLERCQAHLKLSDELAEALGVTGVIGWRETIGSRVVWATGAPLEAERRRLRSVEEAADIGYGQMVVAGLRFLSELYQDLGRWADAERVTARALVESERIGERWSRIELHSYTALLAARRGAVAEAEVSLQKARELFVPPDMAAESEIARASGLVAEAAGRASDAEAFLRTAVEIVAKTDYLPAAEVARVDLASFLARQGRFDDARVELEKADSALTRIGYALRVADRARLRELVLARA